MKQDLVDVFEALTLIEAKLLQDRLTEAGVKSFVDNTDSPLDGLTAGDQYPVVRVLPADEAKARAIVAEFEAETAADFEAELGGDEDEDEPK